MKRTKLQITGILLALFIGVTSCLNTEEEQIVRTAELEKIELAEAIAKLESLNYNVDTTALGVYYVVSKEGTGSFPLAGDTCSLIYFGFFLDGTLFDTSLFYTTDSLTKFVYKERSFIPGFDDGIALMNKGTNIDIIVPSSLAYGATGTVDIPPYTPLVFSMDMKDLKPVSR